MCATIADPPRAGAEAAPAAPAPKPAIEFRDVSKAFLTPSSRKVVLDRLTLTLPAGAKVGVLGRNGAGKSTLLGMVGGIVRPDLGEIRRHVPVSWPLGFSGSFHAELSGAQNIRFVARIYGLDTDALIAFVQEFAELGDFIYMPVRSYSSGMKARLAFGMSMGVAFDWYLVDEITAVGDAAFKRKSLAVFKARLRDAGLLMVSHSANTLRSYCDKGLVLENGKARYFEDLEEAIAVHEANLGAEVSPRAAARAARAERMAERAAARAARRARIEDLRTAPDGPAPERIGRLAPR